MTSPPGQRQHDGIEHRLADVRAQLRHTGPLVTETVQVPGSSRAVSVTRPSDTDVLLEQIAGDPEQNLPYWSEIWPSGVALAGAIVQHPQRVRGKRVLELGSGAGITAAVAMEHGAKLTAADYAPEALLLTRMTTLVHTGQEPDDMRQVNWRSPEIRQLRDDGGFDVILGADLLYERRDIEPLLAAVDLLLAPRGALWLAEPGRKPATVFLHELMARGWIAESTSWDGPWPDPDDDHVSVRTHWVRRPTRSALDNLEDTVHKDRSRS